MKPHFLFPTSPLDSRMIDEQFQDQAIALHQAGYGTSAVCIEENRITGAVPDGATVVYRGWMMGEEEYATFYGWLLGKGLKPFTNLEHYIATHYIPSWYDAIRGVTPETRFMELESFDGIPVEAICAEINAMGFQTVFIKDFVKSVKTGVPPVLVCPVKIEDLKVLIEAMVKYRGKIEGGLAVREFEDFSPTSEQRYFVINGKFYGQDHSFDTRVMSLLIRVARDIKSPFFSVDIAQRRDGQYRIIEIGDGQVSDLVGWTNERFAEIWK